MDFIDAVVTGFRHKPFRFYGRSSRSEFWYFYIATIMILSVSSVLLKVPVVGGLLQAVLIIGVCFCQISAIVRRLHDTDHSGKLVAIPYLLFIVYFIALIPLHAMHKEQAPTILGTIAAAAGLSYACLLMLCAIKGTQGPNRFGTDPLDPTVVAQDFINPSHMEVPEYLGDPWRKFKAKVAREKAAEAQAASTDADGSNADSKADIPAHVSVPTPNANKKPRKDRKKGKSS